MNPFHTWLGLPKTTKNPNHYQLLGIKSAVRDKEVIELAARTQLAKLKGVTAKENEKEVLEKVKARILKAHKVLSSEKYRAEYDKKLLALLKQKHQAAASSASAKAQPAPEVDTTSASSSNIPMAVPIQASGNESSKAVDSLSLGNQGPDPNDLTVKTAPLKKRKKSWLIPIFGLLLCLGGIGGLAYVVANLEQLVGAKNTGAPGEPSTVAEKKNDPKGDPSSGVPVAEPEKEPAKVAPEDVDLENLPAGLSDGSDSKPNDETKPAEVRELSFKKQVEFRRYMESARRSMFRRKPKAAENSIQNAVALFREFDDVQATLSERQKPMKLMAEGASVVKEHLEGFWMQVVKSALTTPGGQPIDVKQRGETMTLGFVEASEEFLIMRVEGKNVTYDYQSLPPGIAMAIAEQGAKEDVPTYRLQKAAFYAVHTHLDPQYAERAKEFALQAAEDGHNPDPIINYLSFDSAAVGIPAERTPQPNPDVMQTGISDVIVSYGVIGLGKMRPEQAEKSLETVMGYAVVDEDPRRKALSFEVAYMLAIRTGDVRNVKDVLMEYGIWVDYNQQARAEQALLDLANQDDLSEANGKLLMRDMISAAKTFGNKRTAYKRKLLASGKKVAKKLGLESYLSQLEKAVR